jgi:stress-induced morphogen
VGSREALIAMAIRIPRGSSDAIIESIERALQSYQQDHPSSEIDIYRQNSVSVRIRIIDPDFAGMSRVARNDLIWKYFDQISDDEQGDISMLVLLTPEETSRSMANLEFDDPVPSIL